MRIVVHWSLCVLERRSYCLRWAEYDFAPLPSEDRRDGGTLEGWRHYRLPSTAVAVEAPVGSRVVEVRRPDTAQRIGGEERRLAVHFEPYRAPHGIDAETVAWMAWKGIKGFRVIGRADQVAKRKVDGGPTLFGDEPETAGAYPVIRPSIEPAARPATRTEIEAIAADVIANAEQPLRRAIERALEQLRNASERDEPARIETARAILECALADAAA